MPNVKDVSKLILEANRAHRVADYTCKSADRVTALHLEDKAQSQVEQMSPEQWAQVYSRACCPSFKD